MKKSAKILFDTGAFVALLSKNDSWHHKCLKALEQIDEGAECYTVESCLTETTFFLQRAGISHALLFNLIDALDTKVLSLTKPDLARTNELMTKYQDLPMDFADAALIAAAERHQITRVFTIDRRDFEIYRPRHIDNLAILP